MLNSVLLFSKACQRPVSKPLENEGLLSVLLAPAARSVTQLLSPGLVSPATLWHEAGQEMGGAHGRIMRSSVPGGFQEKCGCGTEDHGR